MSCGGIAIFIRNKDAKYVTRISIVKLENKFLAVKLTNTVSELVVCVYYGTQASTFGVDQVKFHFSELFLEQ